MGRGLRAGPRRRAGGLRRRPHPQPASAASGSASGVPGEHVTPVDGTPIQGPPRVDHDEAVAAVAHAAGEHKAWARVDLDERKAPGAGGRRRACAEHRDTLALLLVWEIGKPWRLACADVDRALDGVRLVPRARSSGSSTAARPLPGPVSNIASWNYPMSVQVHAELVQCLAGNARRRQDPVAGRLPHPHARARAHAPGRPARDAAVRRRRRSSATCSSASAEIGALAFVGGRANGRKAATSLADTGKRHFLEQEGLNAWGVWDFSQWDELAGAPEEGLRVRQAALHRLPALRRAARAVPGRSSRCTCRSCKRLRFGHPLAVETP